MAADPLIPVPGVIQAPVSTADWNRWQWQMQNQITSVAALVSLRPDLKNHPLIQNEPMDEKTLRLAGLRMGISPWYASLIDAGRVDCPILLQGLPRQAEIQADPFIDPDPLAEELYMPVPDLTHRYPDRVLWYLHHSCAVYCRFCMRRRKVSQPAPAAADQLDSIVQYIRSQPQIQEVILSGGDPLALADSRLEKILSTLFSIPQLISIRIHTRMPVVLPMRITPELCAILRQFFPLNLVTHFNHPQELTAASHIALRCLRQAGVQLFNQSVLLKGINDSLAIQSDLARRLIASGVTPAYLHRADEIPGTAHFHTRLDLGAEIIAGLRGHLPGYAVPRYIVDLPGGGGKVPHEKTYYQGVIAPNHPMDANTPQDKTPAGFGVRRHLFENYEHRQFQIREIELRPNPDVSNNGLH
ncbi:MAG: KamA family radical SAM protein [Leptospiraceae bacterium]|nr:KamA family radical SAM protein [Leptospiraceae bacterium]